jgi:hypothetical protein
MEGAMQRLRLISVLSIVVLACACASTGQPGSAPTGNRDRLVAAEWEGLNLATAFEAVRRLRASWLIPRGGTGLPVIYRNNARWSDTPDGLATIQLQSVIEMRYLNASDATIRFGAGLRGGVILLTTR